MSSLLRPTGGPKVRAEFPPLLDGDPPLVIEATLPVPDFERHMAARYQDETLYSGRSGTIGRVGAVKNRPTFTFGYKKLGADDLKTVISFLGFASFTLFPRTVGPGDDDQDADLVAEAAKSYLVRPLSAVPFSDHLTLGYDVVIELEAIGALDTITACS
ncbi:MAG: hypothetical protein GVY18_05220 [Bacteroidetes bacterium]|jgi:hypothetical protein|nr:hypothetical protein [Bacteroidota bacterium]